ncbi:DUF2897 family protein [Psychromonas sp. RZ22]|uniref:DUF2897 family protein n=1 Tax=Psychromonas algarum TaxID=2555643 RepID=UPI001068A7A2|nr:DUF2897 family protein [Psychromonas sp. RZ22]TEW55220.1 DUF2897 family protein [Psychromonas sp. RZ22]
MSVGWGIFVVVLVVGIIIYNILLIRKSAKMKVPESLLQEIREKKEREREENEQEKK